MDVSAAGALPDPNAPSAPALNELVINTPPVPPPRRPEPSQPLDLYGPIQSDVDLANGRVALDFFKRKSGGGESMRVFGWVLLVVYVILFVSVLCLIMVQNYAGVYDSRQLKTAITQTAGLWTPVGSVLRPAGSVSGNFVLSDSCAAFSNGARFAKSSVYLQPVVLSFGTLDARYLVLGILANGVLFQFFTVVRWQLFYGPMCAGNNHIGAYMERSVGFPLMVVFLCAQSGMTDLWATIAIAFNAWGCALFSFFTEILFQGDSGSLSVMVALWLTDDVDTPDSVRSGGVRLWRDGVAHFHSIAMFAAWVFFGSVFAALRSNDALVTACFTPPSWKDWPVSALVVFELCVLGVILLIQTISLVLKYKPASAKDSADKIKHRAVFTIWTEYLYMILDLLMKLGLCAATGVWTLLQ
jgi:hypothetical protein